MILTAFCMLFLAPALPQEDVRPPRPRARAEAPPAQPPRERLRQQDAPAGDACPNCGRPLAQRPRDTAAPGPDAFRPGPPGPATGRGEGPGLQGRRGQPGPATGVPRAPQMRQRMLLMRHHMQHLRLERMQRMHQMRGMDRPPRPGTPPPDARERRQAPAPQGAGASPTGLDA